jgi:YggT family protein
MDLVQQVLCLLLDAYWIILIARIILSWVPALPEPLLPVARFVRALTDPLLLPLRGLLPPVQMGTLALDLSPILVFLGVGIVRALLCGPDVGRPWS